jgi:hypothetical protein
VGLRPSAGGGHPESRIDCDTLAAIDAVIGRHKPFEARFERFGRLPWMT